MKVVFHWRIEDGSKTGEIVIKESIFRKKSLEKVSSPEDLNRYMHITNPPIWIAIAAVILILIGFLVWGVFGRLESSVSAVSISENGETICYVSESQISNIQSTMQVTINGQSYSIQSISTTPVEATSVLNNYAMHLGGFENGQFVYPISINASLPEGNYASKIITESVPAISFLWNNKAK